MQSFLGVPQCSVFVFELQSYKPPYAQYDATANAQLENNYSTKHKNIYSLFKTQACNVFYLDQIQIAQKLKRQGIN